MVKKKKFLFDQHDFDAPYPPEEIIDEGPQPEYFEEDLEKVKKEAYETGFTKGFEDGLNEGKAKQKETIDAQLSTQMQSFIQRVDELIDNEARRVIQFHNDAIDLSKDALTFLLPSLLEKYNLEELTRFIDQIISDMAQSNTLDIKISKSYFEHFQKALGNQENITLKQSDDKNENDCEISWQHGGAYRNSQETIQSIMNSLESRLAQMADPVQTKIKDQKESSVSLPETPSSNDKGIDHDGRDRE